MTRCVLCRLSPGRGFGLGLGRGLLWGRSGLTASFVRTDPDLDDGAQVREHVQEDAPGHMARGREEVHRGPARRAVHAVDRLIILYVSCPAAQRFID